MRDAGPAPRGESRPRAAHGARAAGTRNDSLRLLASPGPPRAEKPAGVELMNSWAVGTGPGRGGLVPATDDRQDQSPGPAAAAQHQWRLAPSVPARKAGPRSGCVDLELFPAPVCCRKRVAIFRGSEASRGGPVAETRSLLDEALYRAGVGERRR